MFVRLLRAGILVRECVVNVMEEAALPGAVDFCLFHPGPHTADAGMCLSSEEFAKAVVAAALVVTDMAAIAERHSEVC